MFEVRIGTKTEVIRKLRGLVLCILGISVLSTASNKKKHNISASVRHVDLTS